MKIKDIKNVLKFFHDGWHDALIKSEVSAVKYKLEYQEEYGVYLSAITTSDEKFKVGDFNSSELFGNMYNALLKIEETEKHLEKDKEYFTTIYLQKQKQKEEERQKELKKEIINYGQEYFLCNYSGIDIYVKFCERITYKEWQIVLIFKSKGTEISQTKHALFSGNFRYYTWPSGYNRNCEITKDIQEIVDKKIDLFLKKRRFKVDENG